MKHEYIHRERISTEIDRDAKTAKKMFETLCIQINASSKIVGFIRELHSDSFGYILLSELQVFLKINIHKIENN